MGLVHVWEDERDKPNIQITHQDRRSPHVLHGYRNDDPKIKIVKVDVSIPRPQNYLQIRQGNKAYEQEAHSPTRNFYSRCLLQVAGVAANISSALELRKQDNTLYTGNYIPQMGIACAADYETVTDYGYVALVDDDTAGIVLGTGNTAWTLDDYMPETLIQQGVTAGKLVYGATPTPKWSYAGGVWTVIGRRIFDNFNADANTITVKEVCQLAPEWTSSLQFHYVDERTVLVTPRDIPYKSGAVFTYTRSLTIPAVDVLLPNGVSILLHQAFGVNQYNPVSAYGSGVKTLCTTNGTKYYDTNTTGRYNQVGNYYVSSSGANSGCVAGYGTTAVADTDYALDDEFAHGSLENQLGYSTQNTPSAVYDSPSKTFTVTQSRTLTNNYAGNQSVAEIGFKHVRYISNVSVYYFLLSRTVLGSAVVLAQNESISIIYDFTMTHP